jgi:hypothetical protein
MAMGGTCRRREGRGKEERVGGEGRARGVDSQATGSRLLLIYSPWHYVACAWQELTACGVPPSYRGRDECGRHAGRESCHIHRAQGTRVGWERGRHRKMESREPG